MTKKVVDSGRGRCVPGAGEFVAVRDVDEMLS